MRLTNFEIVKNSRIAMGLGLLIISLLAATLIAKEANRTVLVWATKNKNPKTGEPFNMYRDGLKIYTTINYRMQQYAEEAVVQHQPQIQKKINFSITKTINIFFFCKLL